MRKEYPQVPPKVEYTLSEKGETLIALLKIMCDWGMENMTTKKKKNRDLRVIPIVALIIMMFSIVVLAAVNFTPGFTNVEFTPYENPAAMLQAFFGENGKTHSGGIVEYDEYGNQIFNIPGWERIPVDETLADELIVPYISAETTSVSWNDYTLSVEANLYDNVTGAGILYYTLENPNGVTGFELWPNGHIWYPDTMSFGILNSWASKSYIDETMSSSEYVLVDSAGFVDNICMHCIRTAVLRRRRTISHNLFIQQDR